MRVHCQLRALRGVRSLRQLEAETGIHRGALSRYETGKQFPRDEHIDALVAAYGKAPDRWYPAHVWAELVKDSSVALPTENQYRHLARLGHGKSRANGWPRRIADPLADHGWIRIDTYVAHNTRIFTITPAGMRALAACLETYGPIQDAA